MYFDRDRDTRRKGKCDEGSQVPDHQPVSTLEDACTGIVDPDAEKRGEIDAGRASRIPDSSKLLAV
jgi:hypothetical protein